MNKKRSASSLIMAAIVPLVVLMTSASPAQGTLTVWRYWEHTNSDSPAVTWDFADIGTVYTWPPSGEHPVYEASHPTEKSLYAKFLEYNSDETGLFLAGLQYFTDGPTDLHVSLNWSLSATSEGYEARVYAFSYLRGFVLDVSVKGGANPQTGDLDKVIRLDGGNWFRQLDLAHFDTFIWPPLDQFLVLTSDTDEKLPS